MLSWFQALMPKEERFFDLFDQHAVTIVAGAHALRSLLDGGEKAPEHCKEIKLYENDADVITRNVLLAVRRTFITPFDRGDRSAYLAMLQRLGENMAVTGVSFVLPAPEQSKKSRLVRLQLLCWLARYSGYDANDKPLSQTNHDPQRSWGEGRAIP